MLPFPIRLAEGLSENTWLGNEMNEAEQGRPHLRKRLLVIE